MTRSTGALVGAAVAVALAEWQSRQPRDRRSWGAWVQKTTTGVARTYEDLGRATRAGPDPTCAAACIASATTSAATLRRKTGKRCRKRVAVPKATMPKVTLLRSDSAKSSSSTLASPREQRELVAELQKLELRLALWGKSKSALDPEKLQARAALATKIQGLKAQLDRAKER